MSNSNKASRHNHAHVGAGRKARKIGAPIGSFWMAKEFSPPRRPDGSPRERTVVVVSTDEYGVTHKNVATGRMGESSWASWGAYRPAARPVPSPAASLGPAAPSPSPRPSPPVCTFVLNARANYLLNVLIRLYSKHGGEAWTGDEVLHRLLGTELLLWDRTHSGVSDDVVDRCVSSVLPDE